MTLAETFRCFLLVPYNCCPALDSKCSRKRQQSRWKEIIRKKPQNLLLEIIGFMWRPIDDASKILYFKDFILLFLILMMGANKKWLGKDRSYKSLVMPQQLEYFIQVWNPYLRQDMEKLEKVQRRPTKMIWGFRDFSFKERLRNVLINNIGEKKELSRLNLSL